MSSIATIAGYVVAWSVTAAIARGRQRSVAWALVPLAAGWVVGFGTTQVVVGSGAPIDTARAGVAAANLVAQLVAVSALALLLPDAEGVSPLGEDPIDRLQDVLLAWSVPIGGGVLVVVITGAVWFLRPWEGAAAPEIVEATSAAPIPHGFEELLARWRSAATAVPADPLEADLEVDPMTCRSACGARIAAALLDLELSEIEGFAPDRALLEQLDAGAGFREDAARSLAPDGLARLGARPALSATTFDDAMPRVQAAHDLLDDACGARAGDQALLFLAFLDEVRVALVAARVPTEARDPWMWVDPEALAQLTRCP